MTGYERDNAMLLIIVPHLFAFYMLASLALSLSLPQARENRLHPYSNENKQVNKASKEVKGYNLLKTEYNCTRYIASYSRMIGSICSSDGHSQLLSLVISRQVETR